MQVSKALVCGLLLVGLAGCPPNVKKDAAEAREAVYSGSYPAILKATNAAVQAEYKKSVVVQEKQLIQTPWHQLPLTEHVSTREEDGRTEDSNPEDRAAFDQRRARRMEATDRTTRYFVRFDVHIKQISGAPNALDADWKIVIQGFASKWDGTARPEPLKGAETPYWLDQRIDKLQLAIHDKLRSMVKASAAKPAG